MTSQLTGPVLVIGCGLIGTSVALALRQLDIEVHLDDARPANVEVAVSLGAGSAEPPTDPQLVVVAVPPAAAGETVVNALHAWPQTVVTDVASVKVAPLAVIRSSADAARYVGSHPMAGSERSGPMAASGRLFEGRAWAVTAHKTSSPAAIGLIRELAKRLGATVVDMEADTHDEAVALVSHLPHLMSVLAAAQLGGAPAGHLLLAGPGLRDVTRIAGSDTSLWLEILQGNAAEVTTLLRAVRDDLDHVIQGLDDDQGSLVSVLDRGREGNSMVPGKHGTAPIAMAIVFVQIPDKPGELSRLMADTGESGVNIEDIRIDHDLGRPVGLVEVVVEATNGEHLVNALVGRGWSAYL